MEQLHSFADERLRQSCVYCGGEPDSRDHVPSKVLLDEPYPENLPVVLACTDCNTSFSRDEEYLACLLECASAGSTTPEQIQRPKIARILRDKPALARMLEAARSEGQGGGVSFSIDEVRVRNVLTKLVLGHASYELDELRRSPKPSVDWIPLSLMTPEARERFESPPTSRLIGEIGSRAMQRLMVVRVKLASVSSSDEQHDLDLLVDPGWQEVQSARYRYLATLSDTGHVVVRIVLGEYLAAEAIWR